MAEAVESPVGIAWHRGRLAGSGHRGAVGSVVDDSTRPVSYRGESAALVPIVTTTGWVSVDGVGGATLRVFVEVIDLGELGVNGAAWARASASGETCGFSSAPGEDAPAPTHVDDDTGTVEDDPTDMAVDRGGEHVVGMDGCAGVGFAPATGRTWIGDKVVIVEGAGRGHAVGDERFGEVAFVDHDVDGHLHPLPGTVGSVGRPPEDLGHRIEAALRSTPIRISVRTQNENPLSTSRRCSIVASGEREAHTEADDRQSPGGTHQFEPTR